MPDSAPDVRFHYDSARRRGWGRREAMRLTAQVPVTQIAITTLIQAPLP